MAYLEAARAAGVEAAEGRIAEFESRLDSMEENVKHRFDIITHIVNQLASEMRDNGLVDKLVEVMKVMGRDGNKGADYVKKRDL